MLAECGGHRSSPEIHRTPTPSAATAEASGGLIAIVGVVAAMTEASRMAKPLLIRMAALIALWGFQVWAPSSPGNGP